MLVGLVLVAVAFVRSGSDTKSGAAATVPASAEAPSIVASPGLGAGTTVPLAGGGIGEETGPEIAGRTPLRGFGEAAVTVTTPDGKICELCVMTASSGDQRERGLMEVTDEDLGGYDGMLFEYPGPLEGAFWMRNTPQPLSIAYFDASGDFVSTADMEPCGDEASCPTYPAKGTFMYALEVPQGMLDEAGAVDGATLRIHARRCPVAEAGG
ncbi:DUF192 domain-containing protein [Aquihabitans daechungensis]|uniref:DUF192 domain-containing protein n=1 Tax=Aquihabitans daechungensis TaxID=1052257 RepID=UPI003BA00B41